MRQKILMALALGSCTLTVVQNAHAAQIAVLPTQFDETSRGKVPELFDDYVLTAVQNNTEYSVIGQEDIGAMLGFEQQKDLLDCSDTSCIADIGGALGVARIVVIKIARLDNDWVATAKIINIKKTKVEARVNEIITGNVTFLLRSVNNVVARLFGQAPQPMPKQISATSSKATSTAHAPVAVKNKSQSKTQKSQPKGPDPAYGRGRRIGGTIMMIGGAAVTAIGGLMWTIVAMRHQNKKPTSQPVSTTVNTTSTFDAFNVLLGVYGSLAMVAGLVIEGIGTKLQATGAARRDMASDRALSSPRLYWLGWVMGVATVVWPVVGAVLESNLSNTYSIGMGWALFTATTAIFYTGGFVSYYPHLASLPMPTVQFAQKQDGRPMPVFGLGFNF